MRSKITLDFFDTDTPILLLVNALEKTVFFLLLKRMGKQLIQQVREFLYFDPFFYDFDPQKKFSETNSDRKTEI